MANRPAVSSDRHQDGSNEYHGSSAATRLRKALKLNRKNPDDFGRFNLQGRTMHQANYDLDAELEVMCPD